MLLRLLCTVSLSVALVFSGANAYASSDDPRAVDDSIYDLSQGGTSLPEDARGWQESPAVEGEDIILFLPRVVAAVPRYAAEIVFWPLRQTLGLVERYAVVEHVEDTLYNDARTVGLLPMASFQSGFGLSYGAKVLHKSLFGHDEQLKASAEYGGRTKQGYQLAFSGDRIAGSRFWLEGRVRYQVNPALLFAGIGIRQRSHPTLPSISVRGTSAESYYQQERSLGLLRFGYTLGGLGDSIKTGLTLISNRRSFAAASSAAVGKTSIEEIYDTSGVAGFDDGVTVFEVNANLTADFREPAGLHAAGAYLDLFGGGVPAPRDATYWHYGGEFSYTVDLYRHTRLLTLRAAVEAVHGHEREIPFTELPRLGGPNRLRGFKEAQFRDKRSALASVEYHYPIHDRVIGQIFVDSGSVARRFTKLFNEIDRWKIAYGGGLLFGSKESIALRVDVSYGDGFQVFFSTDVAQAFRGRGKQL